MLFLLLMATAPQAATIQPVVATTTDGKTCVPKRDRAGHPTGAQVCRTVAGWKEYIRDQADQRYEWARHNHTRFYN